MEFLRGWLDHLVALTGEQAPDVRRRQVVLVTQEHHVFVGSVRDNIILARESSDDAAVMISDISG